MRASGFKALHDEEKIFQEELEAARAAARETRHGIADWYAFTVSFKGVLLEGLEVVFIVLTFGAIDHKVGLASVAAICAVVIVVIVGAALRAPLARVPENSMKFGVGILLTAFGIFWGAEGCAGGTKKWPGDNWAILVLICGVATVSYFLVVILKKVRWDSNTKTPASRAVETPPVTEMLVVSDTNLAMKSGKIVEVTRSFIAFWIDFIVGDDWRMALGVVLSFAITAIATQSIFLWGTVPLFVTFALAYSLSREVRK